jgi:hypothetical protein
MNSGYAHALQSIDSLKVSRRCCHHGSESQAPDSGLVARDPGLRIMAVMPERYCGNFLRCLDVTREIGRAVQEPHEALLTDLGGAANGIQQPPRPRAPLRLTRDHDRGQKLTRHRLSRSSPRACRSENSLCYLIQSVVGPPTATRSSQQVRPLRANAPKCFPSPRIKLIRPIRKDTILDIRARIHAR